MTEGPEGNRAAWGRVAVFGALTFLQGVIEPTEGLLAQPVRARLIGWGCGAGEIGRFAAVLGLPWAIKPLLGAISDSLPLGRDRRRNDVIAAGTIGALAFLVLAIVPEASGSARGLLLGLFLASLAVALADAATDALVVDCGHADGQTGRYQASQWFCLYASGVITGTTAGALSAGGRTRAALLLCALAAVAMIVIAATTVNEPPRRLDVRPRKRGGWTWEIVAVAAFLAIENFNPVASTALLQVYMTGALGISEQVFGNTVSVLSMASMTSAAIYGAFGPRIRLKTLTIGSVGLGVISNLVYAGLSGPKSAMVVTVIAGLAGMSATLVQFELSARVCPPGAAGTVFAALMAVSNLSTSLATWLGGLWFENAAVDRGASAAFTTLVLAGAGVTAVGWLVVPFLPGDREG